MIAAYALMITLAAAPRPGPDETPLAPELELRVQRLGKEIRCATCQGLSIADSPAPMARSQLHVLREMVQKGESDEQIYAYFTARYGEWVLLEPKATGMNLLAWLGPTLFLLGGVVVIARTAFKKNGQPPKADAKEQPPPAAAQKPLDEDAEYLARVQREIGT